MRRGRLINCRALLLPMNFWQSLEVYYMAPLTLAASVR